MKAATLGDPPPHALSCIAERPSPSRDRLWGWCGQGCLSSETSQARWLPSPPSVLKMVPPQKAAPQTSLRLRPQWGACVMLRFPPNSLGLVFLWQGGARPERLRGHSWWCFGDRARDGTKTSYPRGLCSDLLVSLQPLTTVFGTEAGEGRWAQGLESKYLASPKRRNEVK